MIAEFRTRVAGSEIYEFSGPYVSLFFQLPVDRESTRASFNTC